MLSGCATGACSAGGSSSSTSKKRKLEPAPASIVEAPSPCRPRSAAGAGADVDANVNADADASWGVREATAAELDPGSLWLDVWQGVEEATTAPEVFSPSKLQLAPFDATACIVRRRLRRKQPAPPDWFRRSSAIVKIRRRLNGKQPNPLARPAQPQSDDHSNGSRGHYDVLQIRRSASQAEVRTAYRKQAIATHPDKGGRPEDFLRVSEAFEVLGDVARRSAYDWELERTGSSDGLRGPDDERSDFNRRRSSAHGGELSQRAAARVVKVWLLESATDTWGQQLDELPTATLNALHAQLCQKKAARGAAVTATKAATKKEDAPAKSCNVTKCLRRDKAGYCVKVTWASLNVTTGYTQSLPQAVDWHIALCWLKDLAQSRLKSQADSCEATPTPLIDSEWMQALEMEPSLQASFFYTLKHNGKLLHTPAAQDLNLAHDFKQRFLEVLNNPTKLQQVKENASKRAKEFRQTRRALEHVLARVVGQKVLLRRSRRLTNS
eukprot:TRINITY_DN22944_c0_g5_i2.p1 TRINITY_DN22944_c0_g5~~TRINITY_DN22944_c0_g5_i2.p1  ORF type:complete len:496 (+),score=98.67 TRINITY_DN22944_c0_g5_i2:71-1558(+)